MKRLVCLSILVSMSLSACATIIRGNSENVAFTSNPQGATVSTSTGARCTTPCNADIKRKSDFDATFILNGEKKTVSVDSKTSVPIGAAAVVGNAIAGGIIGIGVDIATGALKNHAPNPVHANFEGHSQAQENIDFTALCEKDSPPIVGGTSYCY